MTGVVPAVLECARSALQHEVMVSIDEDGTQTVEYDDGSWESVPLVERMLLESGS